MELSADGEWDFDSSISLTVALAKNVLTHYGQANRDQKASKNNQTSML